MNDFWAWMEEKNYGEQEQMPSKVNYYLFYQHHNANTVSSIRPTKQMLIGYMMEYLREKEGMIILNTGGRAYITDVYDRYVKDIEKIEQEGK